MFRRLVVPQSTQIVFIFVSLLVIFPCRAHSREDDKSSEEVPRGIYHFSDTDRDVETSFKIPDFEALDPIKVASALMASAMKVDTKRKTLAGIEMPFSLTGRPMSLQINGESHDAVSLVDDPKKKQNEKKSEVRRSDMTPESRKAFLRARQVCLEQSADSCDQALDTFHRVRYGKSLLVGGEEENAENEQYRSIIERRLKEAEKSTPSTSYSSSEDSSTSADPFTTNSESHEDLEESIDDEEDEGLASQVALECQLEDRLEDQWLDEYEAYIGHGYGHKLNEDGSGLAESLDKLGSVVVALIISGIIKDIFPSGTRNADSERWSGGSWDGGEDAESGLKIEVEIPMDDKEKY